MLQIQSAVSVCEDACGKMGLGTRHGVVVGTALENNISARQMPVLTTDVSILNFSIFFLPFCSSVSQLMAAGLSHRSVGEDHVLSINQGVVKNIISEKHLMPVWLELITNAAISGRPLIRPEVKPASDMIVRTLVAKAMVLFCGRSRVCPPCTRTQCRVA